MNYINLLEVIFLLPFIVVSNLFVLNENILVMTVINIDFLLIIFNITYFIKYFNIMNILFVLFQICGLYLIVKTLTTRRSNHVIYFIVVFQIYIPMLYIYSSYRIFILNNTYMELLSFFLFFYITSSVLKLFVLHKRYLLYSISLFNILSFVGYGILNVVVFLV